MLPKNKFTLHHRDGISEGVFFCALQSEYIHSKSIKKEEETTPKRKLNELGQKINEIILKSLCKKEKKMKKHFKLHEAGGKRPQQQQQQTKERWQEKNTTERFRKNERNVQTDAHSEEEDKGEGREAGEKYGQPTPGPPKQTNHQSNQTDV